MTTQDERIKSIKYAREFLRRLVKGFYPRTPIQVRREASRLLRHYPSDFEFDHYFETKK